MKNKLIYILIFLLGALMAATGTKIYFDKKPQEDLTKIQDAKRPKRKSFFGSLFYSYDLFGNGIFDQMDKMTEEMMKQMQPQMGGSVAEVDSWEDDQFIYLKFKLGQINKNSLKGQSIDGLVTVKGQTKIENTTQNQFGSSTSISISSFNKTFPVPEGVKEEEVQIEHQDGALILKFPKAAKI